MVRTGLGLGLGVMLLTGCVSQTTWSPVVDTYGDARAQYVTRDMEECRALAMQASGSTTRRTVEGGAIGGLLGAAAGAAIGAAAGSPGMGAAVGAAAGGMGTGIVRGLQTQSTFKRVFDQCMRNRGHNVLS
jgi:outer membrane lipoprotein SlyB